MAYDRVRWQCSYCGTSQTRNDGKRPEPGSCTKKGKTREGKWKPHTWKKSKI